MIRPETEAPAAAETDALLDELDALRAENARLQQALVVARETLERTRRSSSWRLTAPLRAAVEGVRWLRGGRVRRDERWIAPLDTANYARWVALEQKMERRRKRTEPPSRPAQDGPLVSFLLRVHNAPEPDLRATLQALDAQSIAAWEVCIVDDGSTAPHVARLLAGFDDPRISTVRRPEPDRAAALDQALRLAAGPFVSVIDPGDMPAASAVERFAERLAAHPQWQVAYCDEDGLDAAGARIAPVFKTDWNPDLLLTHDYIGRLCLIRRDLAMRVGGFRAGYKGAEEHDLLLRVTADAPSDAIGHIAAILCHRPLATKPSPAAVEASRRAVADRVQRDDPDAQVFAVARMPSAHRVVWSRLPARVSVIVPTRDRAELLRRCAHDVLAEPGPEIELIVVDNGSKDPEALALIEALDRDPRVRVLRRDGPFNWSALNNAAAEIATGDVLLLLNNDIETLSPGWLRELASQAMRPGVGAVGAKLLFVDGRVQHVGVWLGPEGYARHGLRLSSGRDCGYLGQLVLARDMAAVTGACLAVRRDIFLQVGGLDPAFAVAFNDIDLCLRLRRHGYRIVWTPDACLRHLESASRGESISETKRRQSEAEHERLKQLWMKELGSDPYFNPNLDLIGEETLALSFPPRP